MDERKIPIPEWLPWATTAVLAALVACIGELWILEKTRSQIMRDDSALAAAELKAVETQLEAERIVNRREEVLTQESDRPDGLLIILLEAAGTPGSGGTGRGAVVSKPRETRGAFKYSLAGAKARALTYQLWLIGDGHPYQCGSFLIHDDRDPPVIPVEFNSPLSKGCKFVLVATKTGLERTYEEAIRGGSIVLASPPL